MAPAMDRAGGQLLGFERRNVPFVNVPTGIVTGPVGVGKTTVAGEMGLLLLDARSRTPRLTSTNSQRATRVQRMTIAGVRNSAL